jgi:DedD protein
MAEKDAQIELKKRARRRLVGAVALALLAVIILPMVMDDEPRNGSQDIQVRIPSRDSPPNRAGAPEVVAPAVEADRPLAGEPARPVPDPSATAKPAVGSVATAAPAVSPPAEANAGAAPARKPAADKLPAVEPERESAKPAKDAPPARPAQAPGEAARAQAMLNASGQFVVQLGVFGDPENARKVQARVKAEGYNAYAEPIRTSSGIKTRVRAGPFADRAAAEQAREKLKRGGLDGIVAPKS